MFVCLCMVLINVCLRVLYAGIPTGTVMLQQTETLHMITVSRPGRTGLDPGDLDPGGLGSVYQGGQWTRREPTASAESALTPSEQQRLAHVLVR